MCAGVEGGEVRGEKMGSVRGDGRVTKLECGLECGYAENGGVDKTVYEPQMSQSLSISHQMQYAKCLRFALYQVRVDTKLYVGIVTTGERVFIRKHILYMCM